MHFGWMQHEMLVTSLEAVQSLCSDGTAESLLDAYDAFPVMSSEWHNKKGAIYVPVEVQSGFWIVPEWCADCLNTDRTPTSQSSRFCDNVFCFGFVIKETGKTPPEFPDFPCCFSSFLHCRCAAPNPEAMNVVIEPTYAVWPGDDSCTVVMSLFSSKIGQGRLLSNDIAPCISSLLRNSMVSQARGRWMV
jgi:hypothetical protein